MRQTPRLIIFDLDGTLLNTFPTIHRVYCQVMDTLHLRPVSLQEIRARVGTGVPSLLAPEVPPERLIAACRIFRERYAASLCDGTEPYRGVPETLRTLHARGILLAVASNKPAELTGALLEHFALRELFEVVLCGDDVGRLKPDPAILQEILSRVRVRPDEAIYVGDTVLDIETARRAGIRVAAVPTGSSSDAALKAAKPDLWLRSLQELLEVLPPSRDATADA